MCISIYLVFDIFNNSKLSKKSFHTIYNQNLHHGAKILVACVVQQVATWFRSCCVYIDNDHLRCKPINLALYFEIIYVSFCVPLLLFNDLYE
jgi:hypothetical protein